MTSQELTIELLERSKKHKILILCAALFLGVMFTIYALKTPVTYTSVSTIFPLTAGSDNSTTSSALNALFGGGDNSKGFNDDASVNIIELALSRATREEVAAMKDSSRGNKMIADLLIDDINNHRSFLESEIYKPTDTLALINVAAKIFKNNISAVINKNNSFVLTYTGRSPDLVRTISYGFIQKISTFYIDLKREKARRDFEFASTKVDSLKGVINSKDKQLIAIDKRTLFTNTDQMQYKVPTENLITEKQMLRQQYAVAVANQQNAAYKLQKATPVMQVLDKPEPPYDVQKRSPMIYGALGFFLGLILSMLFYSFTPLIRYAKVSANNAIYGEKLESKSVPVKMAS